MSLPTPQHVLDVVGGLGAGLNGTLIADLSTIDPASAGRAAEIVAAAGGRYVDAPVLGRPDRVGGWTLVAGGSESDVEPLRQLAVGTFARAVERVGEVGAGSTLKICNNLMFGAINAVSAEVIELAEACGIAADRFAGIVADSGAATVSPLFRDIAPKMAAGSYEPTFSLRLLHKDVGLGLQIAAAAGRSVPVSSVVGRLVGAALDDELGEADTSALIETYRRTRGRP